MAELLRPVVLVGPPGAGKSRLGRLVAERLGLPFVDVDERVHAGTGRTPAELLASDGEPSFRVTELAALNAALDDSPPPLIAGGSGLVTTREAREVLRRQARVLLVDVSDDEALQRLAHASEPRPLLEPRAETAERYRALVSARRPHWLALASATVDTTGLSPDAATGVLERLVRTPDRPVTPLDELPSSVRFLAEGEAHPLAGLKRAALVLDEGVPDSDALRAALAAHAALGGPVLRMPGGEGGKTLAEAGRLAALLEEQRLPPDGVVVAIGGGALLDLVGFTAAMLYRGVRWIAAPTTLLAMVDAALGGKTAVNLPAGKNLLGAFHEASELVIDPRFLSTLPPRARRAGAVEMLKHALLASDAPPDGSAHPLDEALPRLARGEASAAETTLLLRRSLLVKSAVTTSDPRERGLRKVLNLGHTFGHAVEHEALHLGTPLLHGEAVAAGLRFVVELSQQRCGLASDVAARLLARLDELGAGRARTLAPALDLEAVLARLAVDKKRRGDQVRFIALAAPGAPVLVEDVPPSLLRECGERSL